MSYKKNAEKQASEAEDAEELVTCVMVELMEPRNHLGPLYDGNMIVPAGKVVDEFII